MMRYQYCIDELNLTQGRNIKIEGWVICSEEYEIRILLDSDRILPVNKKNKLRLDVASAYKISDANLGFVAEVKLPDFNFNKLKIELNCNQEWITIGERNINELIGSSQYIRWNIDSVNLGKKETSIVGWAFTEDGLIPEVKIKQEKNYKFEVKERVDVQRAYSNLIETKNLGFQITINHLLCRYLTLEFKVGNYTVSERINLNVLKQQRRKQRIEKLHKLVKNCNLKKISKGITYIKKHGIKLFIQKVRLEVGQEMTYNKWLSNHLPNKEELLKQKKHQFQYAPCISIVVPTYNTPRLFLEEMIESVIKQTYSNWELCIADGNSQTPDTIRLLKDYQAKDNRIKVKFLSENYGIAGNTNACLEMATGEYIGLFDHDDLLTENALYEVVSHLNTDASIDLIYSDEDKINEDSSEYFDPHFKPDWAPDTLRSYNYICHFTVFRKELLNEVGVFNPEFDGSQDYDMILRLTEKARKVQHISKILYHWRVHKNSTAGGVGAKEYTIDAARRAIQAHLNRIGLEGTVVPGLVIGTHKVNYTLQGKPRVSILIPNKDHIDDLSKCIESINRSTYDNYEVVIIENNSTDKETFEYYKRLEGRENIKVVIWDKAFNYSAINNFGAQYATGEYLILLNNDVEIITPNWIEEMLMHCQRQDVGIVGGKLYYADNTIQHAGVIIGIGGVAGHSHKYFGKEDNGYFSRLKITQNLSAVTAALLMIKKSTFDKVRGLDEDFSVAFNDVDLCLKVRENNELVIFTPYVEAYHHESKSRGAEDSPEKVKRFNGEIKRFESKWGLYKRDPYYNENLSLKNEDFRINNISKQLTDI